MKTTKINFDSALAEKRIEEIKKTAANLESSIDNRIQHGIQKLLQIILRNVTMKGKYEIDLHLLRESFDILFVFNIEKHNYLKVEINFVRKSDMYFRNDEDKAEFEKRNLKVGSIKSIKFSGFGIEYMNDVYLDEMISYSSLQSYLAKEFTQGGEFVSAMNLIYAELHGLWDNIDDLWSEGRELNSQIQKHAQENFENQIRKSNYFKEGNFIVIRKIKKDFLEASVCQIDKVQKTTFYCRHHSIEIKNPSWGNKSDGCCLSVENYRSENRRTNIDSYIGIWASNLVDGDRIEVLTTEGWEKLKKEIQKEADLIKDGKLREKSELYKSVKYRRD